MNVEKHFTKLRELSLKDDKTKGYVGSPKKYYDIKQRKFKIIKYSKGQYEVIDRYTGSENNFGQTVTYYKKTPIYGFNYYGIMIDKKISTEKTFDFLKKALKAGVGKSLHRGLNKFTEGKFQYDNKFTEKRGFVEGEEKIFYNKKLIYIQVYHGGILKDKTGYTNWPKGLKTLS